MTELTTLFKFDPRESTGKPAEKCFINMPDRNRGRRLIDDSSY